MDNSTELLAITRRCNYPKPSTVNELFRGGVLHRSGTLWDMPDHQPRLSLEELLPRRCTSAPTRLPLLVGSTPQDYSMGLR